MSAPGASATGSPVEEEEAFKLLLSNSLSGFAVLSAVLDPTSNQTAAADTAAKSAKDLTYVFVSDTMCSLLKLDKVVLEGRPLSEFLRAEDRDALSSLLSAKVSSSTVPGDTPPSPRPSPYIRVRHACGDCIDTRRLNTWKPVEVRAFADADTGLVYLALIDASMPVHVDSRLSDLLAFASHDLRTPCSSILTTVSLMRAMPSVAGDREATSLLNTVDAACVMLLRCVANVLFMRTASKAEDESATSERTATSTAKQRPFNAKQCVMSAVRTISSLDTVPPRLSLIFEADRPLPEVVVGDESALQACVLNVIMTAMRMGAWLKDVPVRMRIAAEIRAHASTASGAGQTGHPDSVTVTIGSDSEKGSSCELPLQQLKEVMLLAVTEAPGRPLTAAEVIDMMSPYGILPADKGGSTGLPLHVASAQAKATGGDLEIYTTGDNCTVFALHVLVHAAIDDSLQTAARAAQQAPPRPASMRNELRLAPPTLVPQLPGRRDERHMLHLTKHMFECLARNCADIFAICRVQQSESGKGMCTWLQYVSPSLQWIFGMQPASMFGHPLDELCHPDEREGFVKALLASNQKDFLFGPHKGPSEQSLWCRTAGTYRGSTLYTVCRTSSLPTSVKLGIRAFDMAVSHELREPVNTIVVSLQVLQTRPCMRDAAAEAARDTDSSSAAAGVLGVAELMNVMQRGASLLQGIVGGIISTRQLDAGELVLKQTIFPPEAVIQGVVGMCRAAQPPSSGHSADATSIAWEPRGIPDAPEPLPALVVGDRSKLALIVQNLVTNAVKFSPAGSVVHVRAGSAVSPGGGPPQLVVTVTDSGRGMSQDEAKACFTAGIAAPTSQGGGTGLGLFLSRAFAQLMGGAISVQTAIGEGATFRLQLPLPVVDPDIASTRTALELESESEAAQAQELSVLQSQHAAMAAGVAEAHAMEESTSDEALRAMAAAAAAAAAKKEFELLPPPPLIRVLVAEDHVLNLRLITRLLSLNGFLVIGVGDGRAALETLIASFSTGEPFDLCLFDMDMPRLTGPEAAGKYRAWEATNRPGLAPTPIVALTANVLDEHVKACTKAGMSLFFSKPLHGGDVALLQAHAALYINQRKLEKAASASHSAEDSAAAAAVAAAAETARLTYGLPAVLKGLEAASVAEQREE